MSAARIPVQWDRPDGASHLADARAVGWGVFLGLEAGLVAGLNFTLAAVLVAALLLRVRLRTFGVAWIGAALLAWLLAPLSFLIGRLLLDNTVLGGLVSLLGNSLWAALLGWDQYSLVGGATVGTPLSALAAVAARRWASARLEARQRRAAAPRDETAPAETPTVFRTGPSRRLGDAAAWLLFGSGRPGIATTLAASPLASRLWRFAGAGSLTLLAGSGPWWLGPPLVQRALLESLSNANRAEVDAGSVQLDLVGGRLEIRDLQVADPRHLDRDRLRIERVAARFQPGELLRGRLAIDELALDGIQQDVARARRAKPYGTLDRLDDPAVDGAGEAPARYDDLITVALSQHLRNWDLASQRTSACRTLLAEIENLGRHERPAPRSGSASLAELRSARSPLGRPAPRIQVSRLRAEGFCGAGVLDPRAVVKVSDLSSRPEVVGRPTEVEVVAPESSTEVRAMLNLHEPAEPHRIEFRTSHRQLVDLLDNQRSEGGVVARDGQARIVGRGTLAGDRLDVDLEIELSNLDAEVVTGEPLAGLSPTVWNRGLAELSTLRTKAKLIGPITAPALEIDPVQLARDYAAEAHQHGNHALVDAIHDELRYGPTEAGSQAAVGAASPETDHAWAGNEAQPERAGPSDGGFQPVPEAVSDPLAGAAAIDSLAAAQAAPRNVLEPWPADAGWEPVPPVMARMLEVAHRGDPPLAPLPPGSTEVIVDEPAGPIDESPAMAELQTDASARAEASAGLSSATDGPAAEPSRADDLGLCDVARLFDRGLARRVPPVDHAPRSADNAARPWGEPTSPGAVETFGRRFEPLPGIEQSAPESERRLPDEIRPLPPVEPAVRGPIAPWYAPPPSPPGRHGPADKPDRLVERPAVEAVGAGSLFDRPDEAAVAAIAEDRQLAAREPGATAVADSSTSWTARVKRLFVPRRSAEPSAAGAVERPAGASDSGFESESLPQVELPAQAALPQAQQPAAVVAPDAGDDPAADDELPPAEPPRRGDPSRQRGWYERLWH